MEASEVSDLWLGFRLRRRGRSRLVTTLAGMAAGRVETTWALRGVTFSAPRGQFLGIIGPNGSGKTSLLRCLGGIYLPTKGSVTIRGRVSNLIDSRAGAAKELSLEENLYLAGAIHGVPRKAMDDRLHQILDFAELQDEIDRPLGTFSAGMLMRVSFSIAVSLDPDIFVVDEVLAVGDESFKLKCLARVEEMRAAGTTIVFVSHELPLVRDHCDRVIVLTEGSVIFDGSADEAIARYCDVLGIDVREAMTQRFAAPVNVRGFSNR